MGGRGNSGSSGRNSNSAAEQVKKIYESGQRINSIIEEYARYTNGRIINYETDVVTLADGTKMDRGDYDNKVRELTKQYLAEADNQKSLGVDTAAGTITLRNNNTSPVQVSSTSIDNTLADIRLEVEKRNGSRKVMSLTSGLERYVNTGRASTDFLKKLVNADKNQIVKAIEKGGSDDAIVNRIKKLLK